ncbi:MAG: class I SAM-dependent methyltransferase [Bacteroidota bacterium]
MIIFNKLRDLLFRIWYWYISTIDKNADITFMNYGYSKDHNKIKLEEKDEKDRYSIQLYDYVASGVDIANKDILEIGSGRGGGISYVTRYHKPKSAYGLDLNSKAIEFCSAHYKQDNLRFIQGNAQLLEFADESFDAVLNVESSHRYPNVDEFINEVYRVLRPGGYFLFTDFRPPGELENLRRKLVGTNFIILKNELITPHVLEALQNSTSERVKLIQKIAPRILHGLSNKFAATEGSSTYKKFLTGKFEYFNKILQK